ncbi:NAD(P)/FAD-dependent oxidoreductase [Shewanella intestini]|uniref:NAD(P)/FAD-dependent oxidoreductase n=1 Tax=Shewanella intestini TaxID=2017544 RepID=A0ABS5I3A0_9GAMM|nr:MULTISPECIES: NAD(P)/FAD-dependent oxidoreductase [Shewanella]MBR9728484.1 NAD(P)/FAD-dependent oxidoreductase [Shewanella intestini]MRG36303.1 NAD(P)/FAD-dependent oxidoreductase [Shewanella sp. XMDDZSB0408]
MNKIVVVGGGAGGMELITKIGKRLGKAGKAEITLVDICNHHIWKPLLHELATGSLDEGTNAVAYQVHGSNNGYIYQRGALTGIDRENRQIILAPLHSADGRLVLEERRIDYDYLVIGIGGISNDFGIPGVKEHAFTLDLTEQAMILRERIQHQFMQHANGQQQGKMKVAVVGAGATGVEMAAELHQMAQMLRKYGYQLEQDLLDLTLVEASDSVMPALPQSELRKAVYDKLVDIGINVSTNTLVTEVTKQGLTTKSDQFIEADLVIWAAGVKAPEVLSTFGLAVNRANQLMAADTGRTLSDERIFTFGDCACIPQQDGSFLPARGQTARQVALMIGTNLIRLLEDPNAKLERYVYKDLGSFVNLAHFNTIGNMFSFFHGGLQLAGSPARFVYASLYRRHILALHGPFKGTMILLIHGLNRLLRPQLKLW